MACRGGYDIGAEEAAADELREQQLVAEIREAFKAEYADLVDRYPVTMESLSAFEPFARGYRYGMQHRRPHG